MTIEEKARAYDEALEKLKEHFTPTSDGIVPDNISREQIEDIFSELKESEDERIRKELIDYINCLTVTPNNIDRYNSWIAWLERQSNKAVISHRFNVGDWIISKWGGIYQIKEVMSGNYNLLCGGNTEEINSIAQVDNNSRLLCISDIKKLKEQASKPEWSEEDEHHWKMCLECVEECATQEREDFSKTIDWLKSLKQRLGGEE